MQDNKVFIDNNNMKNLVGAIKELKANKSTLEHIDTFDSQKYYMASKYIKNVLNLIGGNNTQDKQIIENLKSMYKQFNNLSHNNKFHKINSNIACNFTNNNIMMGGSIIGINKNQNIAIKTTGGIFNSNLKYLVKDNNMTGGTHSVSSSNKNKSSSSSSSSSSSNSSSSSKKIKSIKIKTPELSKSKSSSSSNSSSSSSSSKLSNTNGLHGGNKKGGKLNEELISLLETSSIGSDQCY